MKNKIRSLVQPDGKLERTLRRLYYRFPYRYRSSIAGKNNKIICKGNIRKSRIIITGNNNTVEIGAESFISDNYIYIRGNSHTLKIGQQCRLQHAEFWFEDHSGTIAIGDSTTIQSAHLAVTEPHSSIQLGQDCMLSTNIEIRTGDSHSIIDLNTNQRINQAQNVQIGNHVWIGAKAIVLKGTQVGENSIIGTGSIVTGKVPQNVIAVGIPARVVRENVTWDRERL